MISQFDFGGVDHCVQSSVSPLTESMDNGLRICTRSDCVNETDIALQIEQRDVNKHNLYKYK